MATQWRWSLSEIIVIIFIIVMELDLCQASILNDTTALPNSDFCWAVVSNIKSKNPADPRLYYPNLPDDANRIMMRLPDCEAVCGAQPVFLPWFDIYLRINEWFIPLAILIGSMRIAELGLANKLRVVLQLLANPFATIQCLLSKLALNQFFHELAVSELPGLDSAVQKAFAVILASYEEWENCIVKTALPPARSTSTGRVDEKDGPLEAIQVIDPEEIIGEFQRGSAQQRLRRLLRRQECEPSTFAQLRGAYVRASESCRFATLTASHSLSNCHASGLSKALIGIVSYITSISISFLHIYQGQLNRRTGSSIALPLFYTWVVPVVLLSTLAGEFTSKRLVRETLERLEMDLARVEEEVLEEELRFLQGIANGFQGTMDQLLDQLEKIRQHMGHNPFLLPGSEPWLNINQIKQTVKGDPRSAFNAPLHNLVWERLRQLRDSRKHQSIFQFSHLGPNSTDPYPALCYTGGNYVFRPSRCCAEKPKVLTLVAIFPVFLAMAAASMVLWTLPPHGIVNCRMIKHLSFFVFWGLSFGIDALPFRQETVSAMKAYWRVISWKNFVIFVAQFGAWAVASAGWFNSCICWSNFLAGQSRAEAYVVFDPEVDLQTTARKVWPIIVGTMLGMCGAYVALIFLKFRKGVRLYVLDEAFWEAMRLRSEQGEEICEVREVEDGDNAGFLD
jgi:hypothetical protein